MENTENESKDIVWHYTKMDVLEKMLTKDGVNIRFTNIKCKNDISEGLLLKELFLKYKSDIFEIDGIKEKYNINDIDNQTFDYERRLGASYLFSATYEKDSMIFWNKEYAGMDGVSIGFYKNYNIFLPEVHDVDFTSSLTRENLFEDIYYCNPEVDYNKADLLKSIAYNLNKYYDKCEEYSKDCKFSKFTGILLSNLLEKFIINFSGIYKHNSWEEEREVRILISNYLENLDDGCGKLHAKVECVGNELIKTCYRTFNKGFIKQIMLGPKCKSEHEKYVKKYLEKNGYNYVNVLKSSAFALEHKTNKSEELLKALDWKN
ncbi:MAG: DUF2971 domain-containing protein [Fibromonadales bacterium]|nr:DUF2971 domain-containing protein [Fibromonadales bacterium]